MRNIALKHGATHYMRIFVVLLCGLVLAADAPAIIAAPLGPSSNPPTSPFAPTTREIVALKGSGLVQSSKPLIVDFGKEVTGKLQVTVARITSGATLRFSFSESRQFLHVGSDTDVYGQGDLTFQPASTPVHYSSPYRRSFRWVMITINGGGQASIGKTAIWFTSLLDPSPVGYFQSSDSLLNQAWQASAYTAEVVTTTGTASDCDGAWEPLGNALDIAACSWWEETATHSGADWTDYDLDFTTQLMPGGSAVRWVVRADPATQRQTGLSLDLATNRLVISRQTGSYLQVSGGDVSLSNAGANWTNYTYSFDVRRPTGGKAAGWVFRAPDANDGYMWQIGAGNGSQPGSLRMHLLRNGQYTLLASVPISVRDNTWYHVDMVLNGPEIRTYIDGKLIDSRIDRTFPAGRVGFRENGGETGNFRDVRVMAAGGQVLLSDNFVTDLSQWQYDLGADRIVTTWQPLASVPLLTKLSVNTAYHVTMRVRGQQLQVLLNGKALYQGTIPMASSGRIGFRAIGSDHYTIADVKVTQPNGKQLFADSFSNSNPPALNCSLWQPIGKPPEGWTSPCVVAPVDGAKRDRAIGQPDLVIVDRSLWAVTGDYQFAANALIWTAPQPATNPGGLIDGPGWWVWALRDYLWWSGDRATASRLYPSVVNAINDLTSTLNSDHLSVQPPGTIDWYWTAYDRQGPSTYLSALTILALENGSEIAQTLGHRSDAAQWESMIPAIRQAVRTHLWDSQAGAFIDSTLRPTLHPLDGNALALLAGIASGTQAKEVLSFIQHKLWTPWGTRDVDGSYGSTYHDGTIWPAYITYELLARLQNSDSVDAEAVIRHTWGNMLSRGPQSTIWEFANAQGNVFDGFDSLAHGWSTGAIWALTSGVLGVEPLTPGFRQFRIEPEPGDLSWARGQVPTPAGPITVHWSSEPDDFRMTLTVPPGTNAQVDVPLTNAYGNVLIDGKSIWTDGHASKHNVKLQDNRLMTELGPGTHTIWAVSLKTRPSDSTR